MENSKQQFLEEELIPLLHKIPADTIPLWGKMTLQQMIEHFSDSVRIASGKTSVTKMVTPLENLERARNFLKSEKPFKENTPNPLIPDLPPPVRNATKEKAIEELASELSYFFMVFGQNKLESSLNPFFGDLNYAENIQLLYKHATHHLRQFGTASQIGRSSGV